MLLTAPPPLRGQQPAPAQPTPAPVPALILSAQKIFLANGGMDALSLQIFRDIGLRGTDTYDSLYATIKSWGSPRLVDSPADADIVAAVRFTAPLAAVGDHNSNSWEFQAEITLCDAKTRFLLWTITEPVRPAIRKGTWRKNIDEANAILVLSPNMIVSPEHDVSRKFAFPGSQASPHGYFRPSAPLAAFSYSASAGNTSPAHGASQGDT